MSDISYEVIVGLEIHVQLCTKTKMFCGCALSFGQEANTRVCPVCLGLPGALPVMNRQAVEFALLAAMALHCEIAPFTKWDRKSYYYPDLPKNYQISQYDLPLGRHGYIEIPTEDGRTKRVRILRVHLEEDAGKNLHTAGNFSQVDLNRAGTPLLEIVTEPDMGSPAQVRALAVELQRIVRYLGVSEGDMQKGHMRFEPNINLAITRPDGQFRTPIVEVKNLNSFRALERSIAYEVQRQLDAFLETGVTLQMGNKSTRGWNDVDEVTVLQREKEEAHDYRYFPDPDLVPVTTTGQWLDEIRSRLCELPLARQTRYVAEYGLSDYDAGVLTAERPTADFFERALAAGGEPKRVCNLLTQVGLKLARERGGDLSCLGLDPVAVADLAKMVDAGTVSATAANTILEAMAATGKAPASLAEELNLIQTSDAGELEGIVDQVLAENAQAVQDVVAGSKKSKKARAFLLGQVIQKTKGQANPKVVSEILERKLH
ncbi:MAG TPA: Asp-tRNA(Asn)/Glu-tRNA(Gln) amidotransferase subunit GatB [Sedimentisphaerales bacterium]|nr:Asp-tRNA(Asn)/Glu-tRNA(Gln) amidotransferase subunit GatB [Sedimentisphaerales bacterium]HRS11987.1 Asp-tRNA(Asn)/Glu-tRNA(Gln) amidotransferase subunit GatB [Sedimentisphaerales bacterium]HRV49043.1 Asp-tRNA(Asn)/Glu-tRNA(Gln) amidotransferase subunit GatB [Sedimentisphaerales bacterium]